MLSRRTVLRGGLYGIGGLAVVGVGGGALAEARVVPGKVPLDRALGRCEVTPPAPEGAPATVTRLRLRSRHRRTAVNVVLIGAAPGLPVVVGLHGWGGNAEGFLSFGAVDHYVGDARRRQGPPFAVAAVDGAGTYWHPRASGDDPIGMIADELLPMLAGRGLRTDRIGLLGYSMGGYGALLAAATLGRGRVAATAASFPAVFRSYAEAQRTNPRSFDSAADFARHDVMRRLGGLDPATTWVDCGHSDPFAPTAQLIRTRLRNPPGGMYEGCHNSAFWRSRLPAQLAFLGRHLRR